MNTNKLLIKNARVVDEGSIRLADVYVEGQRISEVAEVISPKPGVRVIHADHQYLIPGVIDEHVHFREPGLTHKGDFYSESMAAAAGGITSFLDMPNTVPQTTTLSELDKKIKLARNSSVINFGFYLGATTKNIGEIRATAEHRTKVAGIKVFMASSTGDMLVENTEKLTEIFEESPLLIATHCEDEQSIKQKEEKFKKQYGNEIPVSFHSEIRSADACHMSSSRAISLAHKTKARLHILHLSTGKETSLFTNNVKLEDKNITSEVCVHHLSLDDSDYQSKGNLMKWNPAIKTEEDRTKLWEALRQGYIDCISTDHAPHTFQEKNTADYFKCPSGGPMVQHSLVAVLHQMEDHGVDLPMVVEKMCHNPARIFNMKDRGFIKEGYYADMALVSIGNPWTIDKNNILYKCGWSVFERNTFKAKVTHTFVNGQLVYQVNRQIKPTAKGMPIVFDR